MENINISEFTNTYSIVAFDPIKKQLGVGMQTHNFSACNRVTWAEPGIGVVATQSYTNQLYAFEGIKMMRQGKLQFGKRLGLELQKQNLMNTFIKY